MSQHLVELMVRTTCGSCARVREQITPVVKQAGAELAVRNVDEDAELAMAVSYTHLTLPTIYSV